MKKYRYRLPVERINLSMTLKGIDNRKLAREVVCFFYLLILRIDYP